MSSVDKDTNVLYYKKQVVVTTPFSEKKLLTTEKATTSDEIHKRTENITIIEEVVKGNDEVQKCTEKITTNQEVGKDTEKLEDTNEAVVKIRKKDSDKFEGQYKGSTGWFNLNHEFKKIKVSKLEPEFYRKLYEKDIDRHGTV